jgi:enoyl-CoA hydratase
MSDTQVSLKIDGALATACLTTEGGLNVLSAAVLDQIADVAAQVREAHNVRVFVLAAAGKVFVAGANIKELAGLDLASAETISLRGNQAFDAIADLPCVTIARLQGAALGGGLELAMACDFRVALGEAKVGLPEASLGLIPGWKGISRMRALAGLAATKRLTFSAGLISASEALTLGLVDAVAADEAELDAKIADLVKQFHRGSPNAIAMIKQALRDGDEVRAFAHCFDHADSTEGMAAFVEKRPASWMEG